MNRSCELSNVTKNYLSRFYCILDDMIQGMTTAPLTDSISDNFIVQMIPHHLAAIEMCRNLLQYTTCLPLQKIAAGIIREQTQSIEDMRGIQRCCQMQTNCQRDLCLYERKVSNILQTMFARMENAPVINNVNTNFMEEMIPHHKGAIRLSRLALSYPICPQLTPILQAIITSQEKGVAQMECLLRTGACGCP